MNLHQAEAEEAAAFELLAAPHRSGLADQHLRDRAGRAATVAAARAAAATPATTPPSPSPSARRRARPDGRRRNAERTHRTAHTIEEISR